ncbi:Excreted virulence factor EspC, type VII ESX diderm [Micromonospora pattaloongensis]|uniref:Excreted virulence factor EspC, type VII ESX diderm n=1 Tax=Micromonospora pattaloongensis TaxID=405436 RepID=A0A1H3MHH3_9ACTN|nr:type VII secretion target [Micromonospora pattaloongensis]SDY76130.1 Excreted virulence factor EspC, type VII ESX diderm [Micromonospora pattaloongensis]
MRDDPIQVDPGAVRRGAAALADTGDRLADGLRTRPGLTVEAPGWHAATALHDLAAAMHAHLGGLGGEALDTGARLRAAAGEYEAADDRAARRTRALR